MKNIRPSILIIALVIILLSIAATYALAQEESPIYYACVNNSSGTIFIVDADTACKSNEFRISWNKEGPPGPPGVSEAWKTDRCLSVGCGPLLLTPDNGQQDVWFVDLPTGSYVFNVSIFAAPTILEDEDGNLIGPGPGGPMNCRFFGEDAGGNREDLTGKSTPSFGNDITQFTSTALTHDLEVSSDMRFVLACELSVHPGSSEDEGITIYSSYMTATKVDQIHRPNEP
jgi:hypothetical protein